MEVEEKIRIQNSFIRNETDVIVATTAFGMGVDKDNVKMVVHYDISDSLENYLQEAGRAGRKDTMQAHCHLLFDEKDLSKHFNLLQQTKLNKKEIGQIWKAIKEFKYKKPFTKSALEIARQAGWDTDMMHLETQVKSALAALEDARYIKRGQNAPQIFARNILVDNVEAANKIIHANAHLLSDQLLQEAIRIFQYLISRQETRVDYMAEDLGISKEHTEQILLYFKEWKLLEDAMALTAFINSSKSKKNSLRCFQHYATLEQLLLDRLLPSSSSAATKKFSLKELNHQLQQAGHKDSNVEALRTLLQYWESRHYIYKERLDALNALYKISFRKDREALVTLMQNRHSLAKKVVDLLCRQNEQQIVRQQKEEDTALAFSMTKLKEAVEHIDPFHPQASLIAYEGALLYLNYINSIKLEGCLFVFYNGMRIERLEHNPYKQYTQRDYAKLSQHYEQKTAQIHIMGEYAKKQLVSYQQAMTFVDDYFELSYQDFVHKYFREQKGRLKEPITEKMFKEIFGTLSKEQLDVVKDKEHDKILVGAGPGSGKTRVLVHKVAALLTMEDIKTDQFLMLTFSRPAALEFKQRLHQLIGSAAYRIAIFTYHGYAFRLLGKPGDLQSSAQVIAQATEALRNEDIPTGSVKAKSVIMVDEYQDINEQEYAFLQELIRIAEEVRIIVVGDDDQNIYEFRGSSVAFMHRFRQQQQAYFYSLTKNYRACANLVDFSNAFLRCFSSDRLKAKEILRVDRKEIGAINLHCYEAALSLVVPLVNDVERGQLRGTIAILTATNEEALLVMTQLRQKGIPAQAIASQQGFSLAQMLELKTFSYLLRQAIQNELGGIASQDWKRCKEQLTVRYASSANLSLAQDVITAFERATDEKRYWSDWLSYLHEVRSEDFVMPEKHRIYVSTMHKAKGKEFDHVFLMLKDYLFKEEARKRVVYVAITRAKQSLHIHTDQHYFNSIQVDGLQRKTDTNFYEAPQTLEIELAMQDVWLNHFKSEKIADIIRTQQAGMCLLSGNDLMQGLLTEQQEHIIRFSRKFQQKLACLAAQGYTFQEARISYIVVWYCEDDGKEYRVILPKICLQRK